MSAFIARNVQPDPEMISEELELFDELWPDVKQGLHERPYELLGPQIKQALRAFAFSAVLADEAGSSLRYLRIAANLGASNFEGATNPGLSVSREVDGEILQIKGEQTSAFVDTNTWQLAFFSAISAGLRGAVETLALVPAALHQQANIKPDPFDLTFVAMLKGLFDPSADIGSLIIAANEAANARNYKTERDEYVTHLMTPLLPLYRCILSNAEGEFSEKLKDAVEAHLAFWGTKDRAHKWEGWISLPLLATCRIARDHKKFRLSVETDYIPKLWERREDPAAVVRG